MRNGGRLHSMTWAEKFEIRPKKVDGGQIIEAITGNITENSVLWD